jgi:NADP-dependent aldehyde dehydrogenase
MSLSTDQISPARMADTTAEDLERIIAATVSAAGQLAAQSPQQRAELLRTIAGVLEASTEELVTMAAAETHLPEARLRGELTRTTFQLELFAEEVLRGHEVRIDAADPEWPMGPRPDLRRTMIPLGPVLVFAASNFPFAFSVPGGDTASAMAAGCPVIVKVHRGHPVLSIRVDELIQEALDEVGAPEGTFALIHGTQAGIDALGDPRIQAGAFTGSISGGRALFDVAQRRPQPIPFFGELGSNNPVFVTQRAAQDRAQEIAAGFMTAVTGSAGQLCTKPGTLFVPAPSGISEEISHGSLPGAAPLLTTSMEEAFIAGVGNLVHEGVVRVLTGTVPSPDVGASPLVARTSLAEFMEHPELREEQFGPYSLVVEYEDEADLLAAAESFEGQLTGTIHGAEDDQPHDLVEILVRKCGRLLWNAWPTGVSVTPAQHHGGPYPASTAVQTTSVGMAAMDRFLRPVTFQGFPEAMLPAELRQGSDHPVRRG